MGGPGFGQGLVQGLQQAQDRQTQFAELKLRQDHAKSVQKSMEAEDQMKQLQLQSLQRKMEGQSLLDQMEDKRLAQSSDLPVTFDRRELALTMQAAAKAGVDPNEVLNRWAVSDTTGTIAAMRNRMRPSELVHLKEGEELLEVGPGEEPASTPSSGSQSRSQSQYQYGLEKQQANEAQAQRQPGEQSIDFQALSSRIPKEGLPAPGVIPSMAQAAPTPAPPVGRSVKLLAERKPKEPKKALNASEAEIIGDFANTYSDKMTMVQQALGHTPSLNDIGQYFTPQEFSAVMSVRQVREEQSRVNVARETGVNAAKTAAEARRKEPILEEAGKFFRFNPQTGLIDGISDPMMSKEDVSKAGYRQVATTHADKIERFNDIEFMLKPKINRLREIASAIITASGGMNAWKQGASLNFDALRRSGQMTSLVDPSTGRGMTLGEATQLYKSQIDTIREPYARSINGLVGAATERDVQYAGAAFTSLTETTAINAAKFQEIDARLDDVKRSAIASVFGAQAVPKGQKQKPLTGAEADTDFLSMLPPEVKQKYLKKSPEEQSKYKRFYLDKMEKAIGKK